LFTGYRARVPDFHVETIGSGPRVLFVHGSGNAAAAWDAQRELADRFSLVLPTRSGYPPNPAVERIDFERQAAELAPLLDGGAHLVGHSYGGVIAMLIAAAKPRQVRSLVVSEPPALELAADNAAAERLVAELTELFRDERRTPLEHVRRFVRIVGVDVEVPDPLPAEDEATTRAAMLERPPWEAELPLDELGAAPFPKLVLSGGHHPAFEAVCDVLEDRLRASRLVLPGKGHGIPRAPGYNETLTAFLEAA
jgi:pimeloyl-ACP methyl ester carboxylesterase